MSFLISVEIAFRKCDMRCHVGDYLSAEQVLEILSRHHEEEGKYSCIPYEVNEEGLPLSLGKEIFLQEKGIKSLFVELIKDSGVDIVDRYFSEHECKEMSLSEAIAFLRNLEGDPLRGWTFTLDSDEFAIDFIRSRFIV